MMARTRKVPAMPLYGKDAYTDERFMLLGWAEQGLFWRLAWWQWDEGSIPANPDSIVAIVGKERDTKRLLPAVLSLFEADPNAPGRLINTRVEEHWREVEERRERQSRGASVANAKRWSTDDSPSRDIVSDLSVTDQQLTIPLIATRDATATAVDLVGSTEKNPKKVRAASIMDPIAKAWNEFSAEKPDWKLVGVWVKGGWTVEEIAAAIREIGPLGHLAKGMPYLYRVIESNRRGGTKPAQNWDSLSPAEKLRRSVG